MMENLLEIKNLCVGLEINNKKIDIIKDISFNVKYGEIVGVIGESGSGKTITALSLLGILPFNAYMNFDLFKFSKKNIDLNNISNLRGKKVGIIFQDPLAYLDPVFTVGYQLVETISYHKKINKKQAKEIAINLLKELNFKYVYEIYKAYPKELSGGMAQKIMIALAICSNPELLIADEALASLDVMSKNEILHILKYLNKKYNMSILFISHQLSILEYFCDRILVIYGGEIIETLPAKYFKKMVKHPYTKGIVNALPIFSNKRQELYSMPGYLPDVTEINRDLCIFFDRCDKKIDKCKYTKPSFIKLSENHMVKCFLRD